MTEAAAVTKTYVSDKPFLSFSHPGAKDTIHFVNGLLTTADSEIQEHIEASEFFGRSVRLQPSPRAAAVASALLARKNAALAAALASKAVAAIEKDFPGATKDVEAAEAEEAAAAKAKAEAAAKAAAPVPAAPVA